MDNISQEADQQANRKFTLGDKVNSQHQNHHLAQVGCKSIDWREHVVGNAGFYCTVIVGCIHLFEPLPEIIPAIKGNHDFEIIQAFLNLGAQISCAFHVLGVPLFHPG